MTRPDDDREVPEHASQDDDAQLPEFEAPFEAEPADALEQAQEVPDDDEYRSS